MLLALDDVSLGRVFSLEQQSLDMAWQLKLLKDISCGAGSNRVHV